MSYFCQSGTSHTSDRCFRYGCDCAKTPCGKSSTGDRLLLCVMRKVSVAFSFLSFYQPQKKKIFLFPPLPIIGPYNAHRNPISYTPFENCIQYGLFPLLVVWSVYCFTATSDPTLFLAPCSSLPPKCYVKPDWSI